MSKALAALAGQALACIEDPVVIEKIPSFGPQTVHPCTTSPTHLHKQDTSAVASRLPPYRAPPQANLFD